MQFFNRAIVWPACAYAIVVREGILVGQSTVSYVRQIASIFSTTTICDWIAMPSTYLVVILQKIPYPRKTLRRLIISLERDT